MAKPTSIGGVELGSLPPQFEPPKPGRVLILDGDAAAYKVAATCKTMPTALNHFGTAVLTEMMLTKASSAVVHLTAHNCAKMRRADYPTIRPYQGNRKDKVKPPLLETLREALGDMGGLDGHDITITLNREMEADDAMRMDAEGLQDAVVSSADKDLRQLTQPWYEASLDKIDVLDDPFGWVGMKHTASGSPKPVGHGHSFVLAQWLMGDSADNVRGLPTYEGRNVGPVKAVELVQEWGSVHECIHRTLHAYAKVKADALAEFEMLWLRRSPSDCGYKWLSEQDLEPKWQAWLDRLHLRHQKILNE